MNKPQSKQAVIYARYSPRRNADECDSCETQIDYCTNYCIFHKLEVLSTHRDDGLSGATAEDRPGLQDALRQTMKNQAVLVVYSLSRLARNTRETIEIGDQLQKAKANLCSVTENIDTTTAMGSAFFQIIAVLAELERKQISERTSDAMLYHQRNGRRMSNNLPFGWRRDPSDDARMLPDETELEIIEEIKGLREQDFSLREIAAQLKEWGYEPRPVKKKFKGRPVMVKGKWHFGTVRNILKKVELEVF